MKEARTRASNGELLSQINLWWAGGWKKWVKWRAQDRRATDILPEPELWNFGKRVSLWWFEEIWGKAKLLTPVLDWRKGVKAGKRKYPFRLWAFSTMWTIDNHSSETLNQIRPTSTCSQTSVYLKLEVLCTQTNWYWVLSCFFHGSHKPKDLKCQCRDHQDR